MKRVLLTNDDGIDADGLRVLEACARRVFSDVLVVAPAGDRSGVSHGLTIARPMPTHRFDAQHHSVEGTPVDCVLYALGHLCNGDRPELVISGINKGANLGADTYYSGTVAAAREARIRDVPGLAISLVGPRAFPFEEIAPAVEHLLHMVATGALPTDYLLNANFPVPDPSLAERGATWGGVPGLAGLRSTRLGRRDYAEYVEVRKGPDGRPAAYLRGSHPVLHPNPGTDCAAVLDGYVSLTPIRLDNTAYDALESLGALAAHDAHDARSHHE